MQRRIVAGVMVAALALGAGGASAQTTTSRAVLSLEGAKQLAAAAAAEAKRLGAGGAIAVVDDGGHLLYLERLDDTFPAASSVAIGKARTAAQFRRETAVFEDAIAKGRGSLTAVMEMVPLQGGVPVMVNGAVAGAIGVSGAKSAAQDTEIALAATASFGKTAALAR